jgi:hypothetical protein
LNAERRFYVYSLIDPRNGSVFYIGKGKGKRTADHLRDVIKGIHYNPKLSNKIKKIIKKGLVYDVEIMFSSDDPAECFRKEMEWIAFYGRASLTNLTDGGDGGPIITGEKHYLFGKSGPLHNRFGKHQTPEARAKMSASKKGKPGKRGKDNPRFGKHLPEETKQKIREALKANSNSVGNTTWLGRHHSEESKQKNREAHKGQKPTALAIQRTIETKTGVSPSDETRAKLRISQTARRLRENGLLQKMVSDIFANEDKLHPLSDREVSEAVAKLGYKIQRRLVAAYRKRLNIPPMLTRQHSAQNLRCVAA